MNRVTVSSVDFNDLAYLAKVYQMSEKTILAYLIHSPITLDDWVHHCIFAEKNGKPYPIGGFNGLLVFSNKDLQPKEGLNSE